MILQRPLERAGDVTAVLERPEPRVAQSARPLDKLLLDLATSFGERPPELADGDSSERVLCTSTPITII